MKLKKAPEKLAEALLLPINTAAVIILGVYTVIWGAWLANPWTNVFTHAALYSVLGSLAPELFWGCLAISCGLITIHGAMTRRYRPLMWGSSISGWHWTMIAVFYFIGDPINTGGITALTFAVYSAYIYLNIRVNFGKDKKNRRLLR